MATLTVSNQMKFDLGSSKIDFTSDVFKVALMQVGFTFDKNTHGEWADVSSNEITTAGGYPSGGGTLVVEIAWNQDNTNDRAYIEWENYTFTATGANFNSFESAIVYDDTNVSKSIIGCIVFDAAIAVTDGNSFQLQDLGYDEN